MLVGAEEIHMAARTAPAMAVAHRSAIDEDILRERIGAMPGRQAGEARTAGRLAFGLDLEGVVAKFTAREPGSAAASALAIGLDRPDGVTRQGLRRRAKRTSGWAMARRLTTSATRRASARGFRGI